MFIIFYILPALFFGWSLGSNAAGNIFGPPVASKLIKYQHAIVISAFFIVIGAILQGKSGMETMKQVSSNSLLLSSISVLSAAMTMTLMTFLKVPVSSSQAIIGAIIGINLVTGNTVNWAVLLKVFSAWVGTPLGGMILGYISYKILIRFYRKIKSIVLQDRILKIMTIIFGCAGSYALGANNVANITGVFSEQIGILNATIIGGLAIAFGVLTFSKRVMYAVGKDIANLDYFSSAIVVLAESLTVWIYAIIGIPVSTSQAVLGALIGTGFAAGNVRINKMQIIKVVIAWVNTPISAGILSALLVLALRLLELSV